MASDFERANEADRELDPLICKLERGGYVKDAFYIIILIFKSDNCDFRKYHKINKKKGNSQISFLSFENADFSIFS